MGKDNALFLPVLNRSMLAVASVLGAAGASGGADSNRSKIKNTHVFNSFLGDKTRQFLQLQPGNFVSCQKQWPHTVYMQIIICRCCTSEIN